MITLGIDTSFEVNAGLARDGEPLDAVCVPDNRAHAEQLTPLVTTLIARNGLTFADIGEIAVGLGPGPFTGLRVGIVTAWTLAAAAGIEAHGVCSLDAIASAWVRAADAPDEFVVASDARRRELYWARYENGARVGDPQVSAPDQLPSLPVCGPGVQVYPEAFALSTGPTRLDASVLAADWASFTDAGREPLYLRPADAAVPTRRKSALPRVTLERS